MMKLSRAKKISKQQLEEHSESFKVLGFVLWRKLGDLGAWYLAKWLVTVINDRGRSTPTRQQEITGLNTL